mgnify:CR=1 FL=1
MTRESQYWYAGFFMRDDLPIQIKYLDFHAIAIFGELKVANIHKRIVHAKVVLTNR